METITITLNRQKAQGKAVPGTITFPYRDSFEKARSTGGIDTSVLGPSAVIGHIPGDFDRPVNIEDRLVQSAGIFFVIIPH